MSTKARILLVEDDAKLGAEIVASLEARGFVVRWLKDGTSALTASYDELALVILDLMLPGTYGMDVLKHVRSSSDVPVLILSAKLDPEGKVRALELGADDYVTKPFWPEELVARVEARRRRPLLARSDVVSLGDLAIDRALRIVSVEGEKVDLTPSELDIVMTLAARPSQAITRAVLAEKALDQGDARTLDVHVSRLRKKLGKEGTRIETVWGIGYRLRGEA